MGADSLFGSAHKVYCREPLIEGNLGILEDGPNGSGELPLASPAFVQGLRQFREDFRHVLDPAQVQGIGDEAIPFEVGADDGAIGDGQ